MGSGSPANSSNRWAGRLCQPKTPASLVITLRQPRGVYAVITPWNYPVNIPVEYLAPGIATGNTVVWVPAPTTSMVAVELMRAIESAGLPKGVVNLVMGEGPTVGDEIVAHPDVNGIGFTPAAPRPAGASPSGVPANRCFSNSAGTAPFSSSRMPTLTGRHSRLRTAPSPTLGRSAPRPAACSPTAALSSHWRPGSQSMPRATSSEIPCNRAPPWDR